MYYCFYDLVWRVDKEIGEKRKKKNSFIRSSEFIHSVSEGEVLKITHLKDVLNISDLHKSSQIFTNPVYLISLMITSTRKWNKQGNEKMKMKQTRKWGDVFPRDPSSFIVFKNISPKHFSLVKKKVSLSSFFQDFWHARVRVFIFIFLNFHRWNI